MSYVSKVLQPGETLKYAGTVHWSIYIPAAFAAIVGLGGAAAYFHLSTPDAPSIVAILLVTYGVLVTPITFVRAWLRRWTTEIAVTDRRIIVKHGLFARTTAEMNMDKVESIDVIQSVTGRLLNFGTVIVRGTGSSFEPIPRVEDPIGLRNCVTAR